MSNEINAETIWPIGKHKGTPIGLLPNDYLQWVLTQSWIAEKYPNIAQHLRGGSTREDDCTPEHNAMQLRFVDDSVAMQ